MNGVATTRSPRRLWPWVLLALGLGLLALAAAGAWLLVLAIEGAREGLQIVIDGRRLELPELRDAHWAAAFAGLLAALLVLLVAVPLALLAAGLAMALGLVAVLLAGAVVTAPAWCLALLLWWALRRRDATAAAQRPEPRRDPA